MTPDHPAIETLADHREGLLPPAENARVSAHLAACGECSAANDAIAEVSALLADNSTEPVAMPAEVLARIDRAVQEANHERTRNVVTLHRPTAVAARAPRRTWPVLAAAAATAAILGGAALANSDLLGGDGSSPNAASRAQVEDDAGDVEAAQGGAAEGGAGGESKDQTQHGMSAPSRSELLKPSDIAAYATRLARSETGTSVSRTCAPIRLSGDDVAAGVRWRGGPATLVVDRENRTATVLDCATASRVLFRDGY